MAQVSDSYGTPDLQKVVDEVITKAIDKVLESNGIGSVVHPLDRKEIKEEEMLKNMCLFQVLSGRGLSGSYVHESGDPGNEMSVNLDRFLNIKNVVRPNGKVTPSVLYSL